MSLEGVEVVVDERDQFVSESANEGALGTDEPFKDVSLGTNLFLEVGCAEDNLEVDLGGAGDLVAHGIAAVEGREVYICRGHSGADVALSL